MPMDRRHLAIEIAIEKSDELERRHPVGARGKAAHVREPDRGADRLDIAAADAAGQDALAGAAAHICVEQHDRVAMARADLGDARQRQLEPPKSRELRGGEAPGLTRRPARGMHLAVREDQRLHEVIGRTLLPQVRQHGEIEGAIGIREPSPHANTVIADVHDRAMAEAVGLGELETLRIDLDGGGTFLPKEAPTEDIGMERAHVDGRAPDRNARRNELPAELVQHHVRLRRRARPIHQPIDDRAEVIRHPVIPLIP
jgi:hypothetical protein